MAASDAGAAQPDSTTGGKARAKPASNPQDVPF
jgi:hypothetical protein